MTTINTVQRPERLLQFRKQVSLPVILQTEAAECGLACIAMISHFYGNKIGLSTIRQKVTVSSHGINLKQLVKIAAQFSFSGRAIRLELDQLTQLQMPCILHWEMKHFVVLKSIHRKTVTIHDPALGVRTLSMEQVSQAFTGVALELIPTNSFTSGESHQRLTLRHFWSKISGFKRSLFVVLVLSIILQLFAIVQPYYIQTVVDDVIMRSDQHLLTIIAMGFGLLLIVETFTSYLRQTIILNLSSKLNIQVSSNIFYRLLRLPMEYFTKRHVGDIVSRFGSLQNVRELLTTGMVTVFVDAVMAAVTLLIMFFYSVKLTLVVISIVLIYAGIRYTFYSPLHRLNEQHIVAQARENSHFMESVRAIQTVKLFEQEADRHSQWQNKLARSMNKDIRLKRWNIGFDSTNQALFGTENIVVIFLAAHAVLDNAFTVGMLYAFLSYKGRFVQAMDSLITASIDFKMLTLHFDRLSDIVQQEEDPVLAYHDKNHDINSAQLKALFQHGLEVNNLSFAYSSVDDPVFSIDYACFPAGKTSVITGVSGCGKSTLIKCLIGLLAPTQGQISLSNVTISKIPEYRTKVAGVLQDDQLLHGTIADNIACFDSNMDMQKVLYCAHLACIHDDIVKTNMQYNTLVGDLGSSLSGGQKQRVLLARALYKSPLILFMDEATSHLDINNEEAINNHIKQLSITRVIIAHRPQTIALADHVFRLQDGDLHDITSSVKTT